MKFFVAFGDCPEREDFFSPRVREVLPQYGEFVFNPAPGMGMEKEALIAHTFIRNLSAFNNCFII